MCVVYLCVCVCLCVFVCFTSVCVRAHESVHMCEIVKPLKFVL